MEAAASVGKSAGRAPGLEGEGEGEGEGEEFALHGEAKDVSHLVRKLWDSERMCMHELAFYRLVHARKCSGFIPHASSA